MSENRETEPRWYVVHTYSGYEKKVKDDIENTIKNRNLEEQILKVVVPLQSVVEVKEDGKKNLVKKKMFPAYVFIQMIMSDDIWYVVRNTRGVTGFVGPGSKPVPLTDEEAEKFGLYQEEEEEHVSAFAVGDSVVVTDGVWEGENGIVQSVNEAKQRLTISINVFGRDTPVDLDFWDVKKD
jgi:transcriptional antiterminator NusG